MVTSVSLVNIHHIIQIQYKRNKFTIFSVMITSRICPLNDLHIQCTVVLVISIMLFITSPILFLITGRLYLSTAAAAKSLQSCPTLCDPRDGSPPGSPIPGTLQARTLEWVAISFSNAWKWKVKVKSLSCVWLLATPCTAAHQAPLSMGFSRQEY